MPGYICVDGQTIADRIKAEPQEWELMEPEPEPAADAAPQLLADAGGSS